jgi:hypothetical protein
VPAATWPAMVHDPTCARSGALFPEIGRVEHWLDVEAQKSPVISDGEKYVRDIRFHRTAFEEADTAAVIGSGG